VTPSLFIEVTKQDVAQNDALPERGVPRKIENPQNQVPHGQGFSATPPLSNCFKKATAAKNFHHSNLGRTPGAHPVGVPGWLCSWRESIIRSSTAISSLPGAFPPRTSERSGELGAATPLMYTDDGGRGASIGHLSLGVSMVDEKLAAMEDFPEEISLRLKHLILSHHGEYEFGSPKKPAFLEAFALHLIDDLDAKMNGLGRFIEKDRQAGRWTDFNRLFDRYFLKGRISSTDDKNEAPPPEEGRQRGLFFLERRRRVLRQAQRNRGTKTI